MVFQNFCWHVFAPKLGLTNKLICERSNHILNVPFKNYVNLSSLWGRNTNSKHVISRHTGCVETASLALHCVHSNFFGL